MKGSTFSIKDSGKLSPPYSTYDLMKAFVSDKNHYLAKSQYFSKSLTVFSSGNKKKQHILNTETDYSAGF